MANIKQSNAYLKSKADIITTRRVLARDRMSEFKATNSLLRSLYGNASTTLKGTGRQMTSVQQQQIDKLRALQRKSAAANSRIVGRAQNAAANLYGVAGVGAARPALDVLSARARGSATTLRGETAAGGILARGYAAGQQTVETGLATAKQAAKGQTAQALAYRAKSDAALIAQQQSALDQQVLAAQLAQRAAKQQAALDFANWKKQQDYLQKHPGDSSTDPTQATAVAQEGSRAWTGLRANFNQMYDSSGTAYDASQTHWDADKQAVVLNSDNSTVVHQATVGNVVTQYLADNGISADDPRATVVQSVAQAMYAAGAGRAAGAFDAAQQAQVKEGIQTSLALLYPSMNHKQIANVMSSYVAAADSAQVLSATTQNQPNQPTTNTTYDKLGIQAFPKVARDSNGDLTQGSVDAVNIWVQKATSAGATNEWINAQIEAHHAGSTGARFGLGG